MNPTVQSVKQRFGIMGQSELLDRALGTAVRVAPTDLSVLITGESGTGKEVFSKVIHSLSPRKHNQFVAINCGAIPEGTINSELFGHEKNAFTGANADRKGYFETYNGGTIFLDEIGEMPSDTQSLLLRVLENGEFIRVGSSKPQKTDVRIIAATNVNLEEAIKKGKFREDLFFRLSTVPILVPALRHRREDVFVLFRKFVVDFSEKYRIPAIQLDAQARTLLENYAWPGNIRELKNISEQLCILAEERLITVADLVKLVPSIADRHLPAIAATHNEMDTPSFQEREIFYKVLLDLKSDMNDLKSLVHGLIQKNDLRIPDLGSKVSLLTSPQATNYSSKSSELEERLSPRVNDEYETHVYPANIRFDDNHKTIEAEVLDDNLSLTDHEKALIERALRKNQGRRKEAANDLGISERTLYRKIKEYDL